MDPSQLRLVVPGLSSTNTRRSLCPERCQGEAKWFRDPYAVPGHGATMPDTDHMHTFQHLLWDHPPLVTLSQCHTRGALQAVWRGVDECLLPCHISWVVKKLNRFSGRNTMCFAVDSLGPQTLKHLKGLKDLGQLTHITYLLFLMSVYRKMDGGVSIVTGQKSGGHWTVAVVSLKQGILVYCNSLGWKMAEDLVPRTGSVLQTFQKQGVMWSLYMAHKPQPQAQCHVCEAKCLTYPSLSSSSLTGIVAVVFAACFTLKDGTFEHLMTPRGHSPSTFFSMPGCFGRFLRR
ncbi:hypothetical protein ACOMHN_004485 [Nucella lapillus]